MVQGVSHTYGESFSHIANQFTLACLYHLHKATPEFQRRISYVINSDDKTIQYATCLKRELMFMLSPHLMVMPRKIFLATEELKEVLWHKSLQTKSCCSYLT